jgi:hypothetical protein
MTVTIYQSIYLTSYTLQVSPNIKTVTISEMAYILIAFWPQKYRLIITFATNALGWKIQPGLENKSG